MLKETLISNHYPGWLIDQTFSKRGKQFLEFSDDILETTEKKDIFCSLPYVPGLSGKLKRILQNNGLKVALRDSNTLASFLYSGKDRTSVEQQSGVYKIPCTCGSSYVGRKNQNLKTRLLQHHISISSSLKQNSKPEILSKIVQNIGSMSCFITGRKYYSFFSIYCFSLSYFKPG